MEVKTYINQNAKKRMGQIQKTSELRDNTYVDAWLKRERPVKCYILMNGNEVVNIVLITKNDFDPFKLTPKATKHPRSTTLEYIHTFFAYRQKNFAVDMLKYLKSKEQTSSFCETDASSLLFKKAGYAYLGKDWLMNELDMYRFP